MKNQRKYLFKRGTLLSVVFLFACISSFGQKVSDSQSKKKVYPVTAETTLEIENKYGKILIVPWKKDSVQITADIFLESKSSSRLKKLKNDINVTFSGTRNYIIARTNVGDGSSKIASELRALSNNLVSSSTVEISYTVYLPDYINLVLSNKFGDIYLDDLSGDVDISLSNGALKANNLTGSTSIELIFARGAVRQMGTTTLNLSYAELSVGKVNQMDLVSKSSELDIDTVGVIKIESRRDKIDLGKVEYLYGKSSFTELTLLDFIREIDCEMNYGEINLKNISTGFSRIDLESDYTDITLNTAPGCHYRLDLFYNEKAIVKLPENAAALNTTKTGEEYMTTEGVIGKGESSRKISIKAHNKCYINIGSK